MAIEDLLISKYNDKTTKASENPFFNITGRKQSLPLYDSKDPATISQWKKIIDELLKELKEGLTINHRFLEDINNFNESQKEMLKALGKVHYLALKLLLFSKNRKALI